MPTLWKYLVFQHVKIFLLSLVSFIAILLTARLEEIAHFIGLGASLTLSLKFTLIQIPFILPIAIPISALIASMLETQKMSASFEINALRSLGYSLFDLLKPLLFVLIAYSLLNFLLINEVTTKAQYLTSLLREEVRSLNPLLLLKNKNLMKNKGFYFEAFGDSKHGDLENNVLFASYDKKKEALSLILANNLKRDEDKIHASSFTLLRADHLNKQDFIYVENLKNAENIILHPERITRRNQGAPDIKQLSSSHLVMKLQQGDIQMRKKGILELLRRVSLSLSTITLSLIGFSFGLTINREKKEKPLIYALLLSCFFLISFFLAESAIERFFLSSLLFLLPHLVIVLFCTRRIQLINQGALS